MILFDDRWIGTHGIGRFAKEVMKRLPQILLIQGSLPPLHPLNPLYLSWLIKKNKPSVFYTPGFNPPLYSSSPFVFTIHDLNHIHYRPNSSALKRAYYNLILKPSCHRAFKILTGSEFSRRSIIEWSGVSEDKVINVGYGVSDEYCPEGERHTPGYPYLLFIGNHKPHKNLPRLFVAFALSRVSDKVKLLLSGEPDKSTTDLIRDKQLENNVIFAGVIPESKLPAYYRGAEALIFPSLYEGFGLPVLEAMACATPVVTSNTTALPEVAGKACLLVNPQKVDEIANAIRRVMDDLDLVKRMIAAGIEQARKFTWDKTADIVRTVLKQATEYGDK